MRDLGSSYLLSELDVAYLFVQLDHADNIYHNRIKTWNKYYQDLESLMDNDLIKLPFISRNIKHNAYMFYVKTKDSKTREKIGTFLKERRITAVSHYVSLHSSHAGKELGSYVGEDLYTTTDSERLLRLPLYYDIKVEDVDYVVSCIKDFFDA